MIIKLVNGEKKLLADVTSPHIKRLKKETIRPISADVARLKSDKVDKTELRDLVPGDGLFGQSFNGLSERSWSLDFEQVARRFHSHFEPPTSQVIGGGAQNTTINVNKLHEFYRGGGTFFIDSTNLSYTDVAPPARTLTGITNGFDSSISTDSANPLTPVGKNWSWCKMEVSWVPVSDTRNEGVRVHQMIWADLDAREGVIRIGTSYHAGGTAAPGGGTVPQGGQEYLEDVLWTEYFFDSRSKLFRIRGLSSGPNNQAQSLLNQVQIVESLAANAAADPATYSATGEFVQFLLDDAIIFSVGRAAGNLDFFVNNHGAGSYDALVRATIHMNGQSATADPGATISGTTYNWAKNVTLQNITAANAAGANPATASRILRIPCATASAARTSAYIDRAGVVVEFEIYKWLNRRQNAAASQRAAELEQQQKKGFKLILSWTNSGTFNPGNFTVRSEKIY